MGSEMERNGKKHLESGNGKNFEDKISTSIPFPSRNGIEVEMLSREWEGMIWKKAFPHIFTLNTTKFIKDANLFYFNTEI
jgi:hypothetical protein